MENFWYYKKSGTRPFLPAYVRSYLKNQRRLYRFLKIARLFVVLGPLRGLMVRYYRWRDSNPMLPIEPRSLFVGLNAAEAAEAVRSDGVATGLRVSDEVVAEIRQYCASHDAYIAADKRFSIGYDPCEAPVDYAHTYRYLSPHESCDAVRRLAYDPKLVDIVAGYFGIGPIMYDTEIYWCFPKQRSPKSGRREALDRPFHYESSDFLSLTVFIYLTDVDAACGPHAVIRGTHRHKTIRQLLSNRLSTEWAAQVYPGSIETITGPKGVGFIEDLAAYHKRCIELKPRLMLGIHYTIHRNW